MKKRTWHKGPPPHIGWWNASDARLNNMWRWWNGKYWSTGVFMHAASDLARESAHCPNGVSFDIKWTKHYPKRARVPRIRP